MTLRVLNPRHLPGTLTGWHVLWGFIGFFAAIFIVNGYFLFQALATHTGVVANEPYRKGLAYNARIAAGQRQAELNWSEDLSVSRDGRIQLRLGTPDGAAISGLRILGKIGRPSTGREDRVLSFVERDGRYEVASGDLGEGSWIIDIEASRMGEAEPVYRLRRRLWLKP